MDIIAYCTASSYQIKPLFDFLKASHPAQLYRDVIALDISTAFEKKCIFIFPYGASVFWNIPKESIQALLAEWKTFETDPIEIEIDEFTYTVGDTAKVIEDEITLPNDDVETKLAISHGIAQSVKLNSFETAILKTFNTTRFIPVDLAKTGKIPLSRNEIRKKMGEIFLERATITLHVDALDPPDFFWEYPELESYYKMITSYLDLLPRVEVLNKRLTIIHELFEVLGTELNHQHSSHLEWTIIILIVIEVVISIIKW
jgi:uncharacterized Rmd1/YagE family protein